jgi:regulator of replication initiation timing
MDSPERELDRDVAALEQKLATLVARTRALRMANEALRRDLAAANSRNQALAAKVSAARERLDVLLARMPTTVE